MRGKLSYANVMSTLAVVLAIGGGTTAVAVSGKGKVGAADLKKIVVRSDVDESPVDPEQDFAHAKCRKGEKLTGGGGINSFDGQDFPLGNGWASKGNGSAAASALCLTK